MKALILYRSHYGNTKQAAEAMASQLTALGHAPVVQDLRKRLPDPESFDLILIGAPTRMARVTRRALRVLKRLRKLGAARKPLAVFDTYGPIPTDPVKLEKGRKWLTPGAAGLMHDAAKALGLNVYPETLRCEVKDIRGPLIDGALDKAAAFAREFVSAVAPAR
ncbi:MAG TPA: flavodoxin domain-containing protein [Terriglobales bacterium]|nr:flavodoxin domain-containing protein [Terriglobales bacterium]